MSKNLRLWLILASVPLLLSFVIVGYQKYKYNELIQTATGDEDDWEENWLEQDRIARYEVLDAEENKILMNLGETDTDITKYKTPEYIEAEAEIIRVRNNVSGMTRDNVSTDVLAASDEMLEMDEEGNPVFYEVQEGEWLASIALKLYGHKPYWGYIYDVNRDMLHAPDDVKAGMKLYLPNRQYFEIDSANVQSIQKAAERAAIILQN